MPREPVFATVMTPDYVPGLLTLLHSLRANGRVRAGRRFLVIEQLEIGQADRERLGRLGFDLEFLPVSEVGSVAILHPQIRQRFDVAMQKLLVLGLEVDRNVCFIDADQLCLNPLPGLEDLPHFSAVPDIGKELLPQWIRNHPMINSGFMVLRPSRALLGEVLDYYQGCGIDFNFGDQEVLSHFLWATRPDSVNLLPPQWNTLKRLKHHHPLHFDLGRIRLLHYVGVKPWDPPPPRGDRSERPYTALNRLWHKHYREALRVSNP
jgi:hypothetical protein